MDGGAWKAAVHGVAKSWTRLSDFTFTFHFPALEKEVATHSSVLAWRIPGMEEPGGLLSMGSHRVGHDWSDLAAAAAKLVSDRSRSWTQLCLPWKSIASPLPCRSLCGTCSYVPTAYVTLSNPYAKCITLLRCSCQLGTGPPSACWSQLQRISVGGEWCSPHPSQDQEGKGPAVIWYLGTCVSPEEAAILLKHLTAILLWKGSQEMLQSKGALEAPRAMEAPRTSPPSPCQESHQIAWNIRTCRTF